MIISKFKINLPYIGPFKFFTICVLIFLMYIITDKVYMYYYTDSHSRIDYIGKSPEAKNDILNQIKVISSTLRAKDYGEEGGPWGVIQAHAFYGYSLVNLFLEDQSNKEFQIFVSNELKFIYNFLVTEGKDHFLNQGTKLEHGVIYQGAKNHILAALVIVGNGEYRNELYKNSEFLSKHLNDSTLYSAESYPGIGWYIDNIHAYYSLYLTDKIRKKSGLPPLYEGLIAKWVYGMKNMKDNHGITLAEAYGYNSKENQSRGCSQSWLLIYMYEIDRKYFEEQYQLFNKYFYREWYGLGLVLDTPDNEPLINRFPSGPTLFGYSSSATTLSLPLYRLAKDYDKFQKTLRTLESGLDYSIDAGKYTFFHTSLLDSLNLWGKTHITWGDKL